jgi:hypothetical protein
MFGLLSINGGEMFQKYDDNVNVIAAFSRGPKNSVKVVPHIVDWRGRRYRVDHFGLYHPARRGNQNFHVFELSSGPLWLKLELNPETLEWKLRETFHDTGA